MKTWCTKGHFLRHLIGFYREISKLVLRMGYNWSSIDEITNLLPYFCRVCFGGNAVSELVFLFAYCIHV
jgi:hypothetical protein